MHIDSCTTKTANGTYTRHLLRDSYRDEQGRPRHHTLLNISDWPIEQIEAFKLVLRHKGQINNFGSLEEIQLQQGASVGAIFTLHKIAKDIGLVKALGDSQPAKMALWQVFARIIDQGSRLSAVRLAAMHAVTEVLGVSDFSEDALYANLDWLEAHQSEIENALFALRHKGQQELYLYDVTSSYLEGQENELAAYGYNRDKKSGKKQVVIGLLCDSEGNPINIEVFEGNTGDTKTFASQIRKVSERFGGQGVTFVGDRGMIRSKQMEELQAEGFHYITAITRPQLQKLISEDFIQLSLFDEDIKEVADESGVRYILRKNPQRALEIRQNREEKLKLLQSKAEYYHQYLAEHKRAQVGTVQNRLQGMAMRLKLSPWVTIGVIDRAVAVKIDEEKYQEAIELDGCYVLKTDLSQMVASAQVVHARYKDLAQVEWAFRTMKTTHLDVRPVFVRKATRTRGHVLVVMLAYLIMAELTKRWKDCEVTAQEGIKALTTLCLQTIIVGEKTLPGAIPKPNPVVTKLLSAAQIRMPVSIKPIDNKVATKNKLPKHRK